MASLSTVRHLMREADQRALPIRALSEGQLAEVAESMRLLSAAGRRIDQAQGTLEHCQVPFDVTPFRRVQECLDQAWQALQPAMLAHLDAVDRQKGAR